MYIGVILNNAEVSFIGRFKKNTNYFYAGQKMDVQVFPLRSSRAKYSPLLKKKQRKAKKNIRQAAIKSVAIPPILLSWKVDSSSSAVQKTPRTSGMLPILPLHLLKHLSALHFLAVNGNAAWA